MHLVYYSPVRGGPDERIKRAIQALVPEGSLQTFCSLDGLALRLRQPIEEPAVTVLFAATRKDLRDLVSLGDLLDSTAVVLVLPDRDEETIRAKVRQVLDVCVPGGGYFLGSGNWVTSYIPLDNYLVMLDEGRRYAGGA